jgi:hypothetical protein
MLEARLEKAQDLKKVSCPASGDVPAGHPVLI